MTVALEVWVMDIKTGRIEVQTRLLCRDCLGEMDIKGCSGEVSDGNEVWFIGNWRKGVILGQ